MLRSIGAVIAGYLAMAVGVLLVVGIGAALLVEDPDAPGLPYIAFNLGASILAAALGGWVTRRLAPRSPGVHVVALAVFVLVLGIVMALAGGDTGGQPGWYPAVIAVLGPLGVLAGGSIGARRARGNVDGPAGVES